MKKSPEISVIMPNFNCSCYIEKSIESILNQTFTDFELIVIDDASTDNSLNIIRNYQFNKRVKVIELKTNVGNYEARNIGIENAKGKYIAVMDADDISNIERLKIQYDYLTKNKLSFIGSQGHIIDQAGNFLNDLNLPLEYDYIKIALLRNNCVTHSSLFYNKKALSDKKIEKYQSSLNIAADYAFVANSSFHFEIQNIPERLVSYRIHENQISSRKRDNQIKTARDVRFLQIQRLNVKPTKKEMYLFNHFMENTLLSEQELVLISKFLNKLLRKNEEIKLYKQELLFVYFQQLFSNAAKNSNAGAWSLDQELIEYIKKNFNDCKNILEFGSGKGTDLLLKTYDVVSIENDFRFFLKRGRNHTIFLAPIKGEWYDPEIVEQAINYNQIDLIIIDGPPGELRKGIINNINIFCKISCPIVFDDVNRVADKTVLEMFCKILNYGFTVIKGENKEFAICIKNNNK